MLTTDLGACEWFVWDLRRSNLIDRGQLDQVIGEFLAKNAGAEPPALAAHLVKLGVLTDFQAERLLQGKTQGFVLGPFTLMDSLGTGSMGTVYKAQSKNDSQFYAVKVLPRRSMWNVRIARRKVRVFEQLQHPGIVPFVDVGTAGGMHYLAWPMVEGETLEKIVQRDGRTSADVAARYVVQASEALELSHQQKIFHGLVKPSNLMLSPEGQIKILDFGIGCLLAETEGESLVDTMSTANSVNSGLDCASPESIMDPSNLSPLGDQYSLGCVLYYLLSGQYPFPDGTAVEKMMAHQTKQPKSIKVLVPELADGMVEIVNKLMSKVPEQRYASCAQLVEKLRPYASTAGPAPRPASTGGGRALARPSASVHRPASIEPPPMAPAARTPKANAPLPPRPPSAVASAAARMPAPPPIPAPAAAPASRPGSHQGAPSVPRPGSHQGATSVPRPGSHQGATSAPRPGSHQGATSAPRPGSHQGGTSVPRPGSHQGATNAPRPGSHQGTSKRPPAAPVHLSPPPIPRPAMAPEPEAMIPVPSQDAELETDAPRPASKIGTVAILLIALLAGAIAYWLSTMIPIN
jgi:serine/threonine-protein kinase